MLPKLVRSAVAIAALTLAWGAACAQDANKPGDYRLGPCDSIKVQVYQNPELSFEVRVSESGVVNYPLVGPIQLGCHPFEILVPFDIFAPEPGRIVHERGVGHATASVSGRDCTSRLAMAML